MEEHRKKNIPARAKVDDLSVLCAQFCELFSVSRFVDTSKSKGSTPTQAVLYG